MRFLYLFLFLLVAFAFRAGAQSASDAQDTLWLVKLPDQQVTSSRHWENDTVRYRYNQMRYYVTTILPYVEAATKLFLEIDQKKNSGIAKKEFKRYLAGKEDEMRLHFEKQIKELNETQGVLLIKLIARQTNLNLYAMLSEVKGGFHATRYQIWARLHGFNLARHYHPEDNPDLERIMNSLGYPLPESYAGRR